MIMNKLLILLLLVSFSAFGQSQINGARLMNETVTEDKLSNNALRPVDNGVISDFALVFGTDYRKKYSLAVTSDIALTLSGSTQTPDSYIFISTVPDGVHTVSFPDAWSIKSNAVFDPTTTQRIELYYDGNKVFVDIFNADPIVLSELLTATITGGTDDLNLTFDAPVTITTAGWSIVASGGAVTIDGVPSGNGTVTPVFDLSRNITAGEDVTLSYDPTTGATVSSTGNELTVITNRFVDTGTPETPSFCDITVCATGGDYTTGQAGSDAAVDGQTVCFCAGTYRETIVGKTGVTYRNVPGDVAIISGLELAGTTGWTVHSGNIYKKTITLPVTGFQQNLTSNTTILANQIFKDGVMQFQARWPKITALNDLMDRTKLRNWTQASMGQTSLTDGGLPAGNFTGGSIFMTGWYISQTRPITSHSGSTLNYSATIADAKFRKFYYITNDLDLLTTAKEWHYESNILYFWQTGGGSPTGVEYKARNWGFDLRGKDNVTIQGLYFIGCEPATGDTGTDGCTIDDIRATYTNHSFIQNDPDLIYNVPKQTGIKLVGNNNTIKNSEFQYTASQLIWAGPNALIENNLASDISYEGNYGAFVTPYQGADNIKIMYNTVSRVGRSMVDFGWDGQVAGASHENMEIGYNDFHDFLMLSMDGGATYGARGIDLPGLRIHHNWIHDNSIGDDWQNKYNGVDWYDGIQTNIYFDQGAGPGIIDHNVTWNGGVADVYTEIAGVVNTFYNNTFGSTDPEARDSYVGAANSPNDIFRNNIFTNYVNINWGGTLGNLANNLLTTSNSDQSGNNTINNSPLFVGSETGPGYELQSGSPAINIGVAITGITDGAVGAPDAGAYEFSVTPWVPGYNATAGVDEPFIMDNADFTYTGAGWVHANGQSYTPPPTYSISYSPTMSAYLEGDFTGSEVKYYSEKYNTHGVVEIKIDGVRVDCDPGTGGTQDCDLYEATTTNNTQLIGTWSVTPGAHTFRATLVGVNGSATGSGIIMFDYLLITP